MVKASHPRIGMVEARYCTACGKELSERVGKGFDAVTGEKVIERVCMFQGCQVGCTNTGGHSIGLERLRCIRCGWGPE